MRTDLLTRLGLQSYRLPVVLENQVRTLASVHFPVSVRPWAGGPTLEFADAVREEQVRKPTGLHAVLVGVSDGMLTPLAGTPGLK